MNMAKLRTRTISNQTYSNRVLKSDFDKNWKTILSRSGYVIYIALKDYAKVEVLLIDGTKRLVVFKKNGTVLVGGGGTSHFSKPHLTITL